MPRQTARPAPPTLAAEIGKRAPFNSPEQEAALNILRSAAAINCEVLRFLKTYDLSDAAYNALRILRGHHPAGVPSQTVGGQLIAHVPDVTRLVDRLVEQGLAERTRTETDKRVVIVRITRPGLELLARIDKPLLALHRRQLGNMPPAELRELSRLLAKARQTAQV